MKRMIFLGGDERMLYAAEALSERYECIACGFSGCTSELPLRAQSLPAEPCELAVLPLPASRDGVSINCPLGGENEKYEFGVLAKVLRKGAVVFTSRVFPALEAVCAENGFKLVNYFEREELAVLNAVPTAEGALETAIRETRSTIHGSAVLILGNGRIGKLTARYFSALGARVTVAARKYPDLAWIRAYGYDAADMRDPSELNAALSKADIIINTVPAPIMYGERLSSVKRGALLIELASQPCIADAGLALDMGIRLVPAPGLPGKSAPITAGRIIAETIDNLLDEI